VIHYLDATRDGQIVHGNGLQQLYLSVARWASDEQVHVGWKAWSDGGPDLAVLDGVTLGRTAGEYPILVTETTCYWIDPDLRHYWEYSAAGHIKREIPIGPTSQGFAYWDDQAGALVWMDTVLAAPRPLARKHVDLGWQCGHDPDVPGEAGRILAIGPDGVLTLVADVYTPVQAKIRQQPDGSALCLISLPKDDQTYVVHSSAFQAYTPPAPAVLPPGPIERVRLRRHAILFAEPTKPRGTAVWSYASDVPADLPVMEGIGPERRWILTVPAEHPMLAVWWTRDEGATAWERNEVAEGTDRGLLRPALVRRAGRCQPPRIRGTPSTGVPAGILGRRPAAAARCGVPQRTCAGDSREAGGANRPRGHDDDVAG
jgi:hypothetical protein